MSSATPAASQTVPAIERAQLFVSTALDQWSTESGAAFSRDLQIDDLMYRRLDPEYYAWLRSRMVLAKKATMAGHLDVAAFEDLRLRFNHVHQWALRHFGEEPLLAAVRTMRAGDYKPPVPEDESNDATGACAPRSAAKHVCSEATAPVDAITANALALGWSREQLYAPGDSALDPRRGLVCHLKPGDRIGEVTAQSIEIIRPSQPEVRHRFYNPDV